MQLFGGYSEFHSAPAAVIERQWYVRNAKNAAEKELADRQQSGYERDLNIEQTLQSGGVTTPDQDQKVLQGMQQLQALRQQQGAS